MCKIDVEFCNAPDLADHIEQMIMGLREAAPDPNDDEDDLPAMSHIDGCPGGTRCHCDGDF